MSQGPVLQLLAVGTQNNYDQINPQISFFKSIYKRHSPFALETTALTANGTANWGRRLVIPLPRSGDLFVSGYIHVDLPALTANAGSTVAWVRHLGHALIKNIALEIGGNKIDEVTGVMMHIWNELSLNEDKRKGYATLIGDVESLTTQAAAIPAAELNIPLPFYFCAAPGLAIPIIALPYTEVRITIQLAEFHELVVTGDGATLTNVPALPNFEVYSEIAYLDGPERQIFSQATHEYLVTLWQYQGDESASSPIVKIKTTFAHPTKELIWAIRPDRNMLGGVGTPRPFDFTDSGSTTAYYKGNDPMISGRILFNATERISTRPASYFNVLEPFKRHTRVPAKGIYVYSMALNPESPTQPTGSVNFSKLDSVTLQLELSTGTSPVTIFLFARSQNIFKCTSGLAGLQYSS